jgi:D-amino-acid dehydrogenase
MPRMDAVVLGAGIVGTSIALHLAKRGLAVALMDRRAPGEETSYGNAGVIEGNTVFPPAFPSDPLALLRVALKRAPEANYHLTFLPQVAPWLLAFRAASQPMRLIETARAMRPLFAHAVAEHEALLAEAGASRYLRKEGWLKLYRSERAFAALEGELALAQDLGIPHRALTTEAARELEPSLAPVFRHAVHWQGVASVTNPLAVTQAYAARFGALGGVVMRGDARSVRRADGCWRVDTAEGPLDASQAVLALGPFAPDVLAPLSIALPLGIKRGYHRHYRASGNAALARPVVDTEIGYCLAPMEQGIRLTTGAEFRRARCPADAGAVRALAAQRKGALPVGRAGRGLALDGQPAMLSGFTAGDRPGARPGRPLARLRPCPLGLDARPRHRAAHRGDDDRRDAVLRSDALRSGAIWPDHAKGASRGSRLGIRN